MNEFDIIKFLKTAVQDGASDVHLYVDSYPSIRKNGDIVKYTNMSPLSVEDINSSIDTVIPQIIKSKIDNYRELDFSYDLSGCSRFRVNISRQLNKKALVLRTIPYKVKSTQELYLPYSIKQFSNLNNGLVLFTGPTGCGKSSTIAALINIINENYAKHIITIEDPIEFVFPQKKSIISQRQVPIDTLNLINGLKYAMRQDPDIIFVGEIRDKETAALTLEAAETGHLVFSTIHTNNAVQTVNRIVNMFELNERQFVREQLANVLRGTVAQKLVPNIDGSGRRVACELLVCTPTVKDYILKDKLDEIYELVKKGLYDDMITLNQSLFQLCRAGHITQEKALEYSDYKSELSLMFRGGYHGSFNESGRKNE